MTEIIDAERQDLPTCPYCGHVDSDYYHIDESGTITACPNCDRDYFCTRIVDVVFSSEFVKDKGEVKK